MAAVALVGTLDTKGEDLAFLAGRLRAAGAEVIVVDAGTGEPDGADPRHRRRGGRGGGRDHPGRAARGRGPRPGGDRDGPRRRRGRRRPCRRGAGSAGCSRPAARAAPRSPAQVIAALPVGLPKLLVSTMASGDVSPYVGAKDVCVMYSVVDVAGINRISRVILGNAAAAMAGMVAAREAARGAKLAGGGRG